MASIMAGYPINMGGVISANISLVAHQTNMAYPYPSTITEYFTNAKVEPRTFDIKVKSKKPFEWHSLMDLTNPKKSASPSTTTGQFDELADWQW